MGLSRDYNLNDTCHQTPERRSNALRAIAEDILPDHRKALLQRNNVTVTFTVDSRHSDPVLNFFLTRGKSIAQVKCHFARRVMTSRHVAEGSTVVSGATETPFKAVRDIAMALKEAALKLNPELEKAKLSW